MIAIGLVGEYVARIYEEAKGRPLYVVSESANAGIEQPNIAKGVVLPAQAPNHEAVSHQKARKAASV